MLSNSVGDEAIAERAGMREVRKVGQRKRKSERLGGEGEEVAGGLASREREDSEQKE